MLLCAGLLSSCGPASPFGRDSRDAPGAPAQAASGGTTTLAPLVSPPPGAETRPLRPGETGTTYTPSGLPALQPRGVNVENLFAEPLRDTGQRFNRLENAVLELRREFNAVMPSIIRLAAVEADIQDLIRQLELLLRNEPPPQPVFSEEAMNAASPVVDGTGGPVSLTPAPATAPSPPVQAAPAAARQPPVATAPAPTPAQAARPPAGQPGAPVVERLRIGEHGDKTRLVLDITGRAAYSYDLDNAENLLVVELRGTGWRGQTAWSSANAPLLASYTVQPMDDGNGSRLIIMLKHGAEVVNESVIPPNGASGYRIVIDLRSPTVHR